ncbi:MAG: C10 family peptidase [Muribaculaceae bacterium]|nr:C10 family peptidase [Muribaculaceae bacterium]
MRKCILNIVLIAITSLLTCCSSNEEPILENTDKQEVLNKYEISQEEALNNAVKLLSLTATGESRASAENYKVRNVTRVNQNPDSRAEDATNGCYLFNFDDNKGFALVSADKRDSVPVYISAEKGNLPVEILNDEVNGIGYLMGLVANYQDYKVETYTEPIKSRYDDNYEIVETTTVVFDSGQLINTAWHQDQPFNVSKPGYLMGCVPVAMGQIMAYHKHPSSVTVNGTNYNFNWNHICAFTDESKQYAYPTYAEEVSDLLLAIGIKIGATYEDDGTGAYPSDAPPTFRHFGYSCSSLNNYDISTVRSELLAKRPVFMGGYTSENKGHAWVATRYNKVEYDYKTYNSQGELMENTILEMFNYTHIYEYLYVNWGGGSFSNRLTYSFRQAADLYNTSLTVYSNIFQTGSKNYSTNVKMITGIQPN